MTLPELADYYNTECLREARELLEYKSYLDGKFEVAKTNKDLKTLEEIHKEFEYYGKRLDELTPHMAAIQKLVKAFSRMG